MELGHTLKPGIHVYVLRNMYKTFIKYCIPHVFLYIRDLNYVNFCMSYIIYVLHCLLLSCVAYNLLVTVPVIGAISDIWCAFVGIFLARIVEYSNYCEVARRTLECGTTG